MRLQVECYSGYRGEETPRRLVLGEKRLDVLEVVDRWLSPEHRYFKLRCDDGATYIVRHDIESLEWELTVFDAVGNTYNPLI